MSESTKEILTLKAPAIIIEADTPFRVPYRPVLAQEKVAFVGQPVAAVIARTEAEALDAAEVVGLDIDTLDPLMDPLTATTGETIWAEVPDNSAFRWHKGNPDESARLREHRLVGGVEDGNVEFFWSAVEELSHL